MKYKRIGLMFAGQGAQLPCMGKDLFDEFSSVRKIYEQIDNACQRKISELCFTASLEELTLCANCQPAIFATSMGCFAALKTRIPEFAPVICGGLSLGEYAALCTAGVYSISDAARLVSQRGLLMDEVCHSVKGGMAAVLKQEQAEVEKLCCDYDIDIANFNCPGQLVISGPENAINAAVNAQTAAGKMIKKLEVGGAYHSRVMQPAADKFAPFVQTISMLPPTIPVVQNYTGTICTDADTIPANLVSQISGSVRWESCARIMMDSCDLLVELGPGKVLCGLCKRIDRSFPTLSVSDLTSLNQTVEAILS